MQDEPQNSGADPREDPKVNTLEDHLNVISVVQQNAVVITSQGVRGGQSKPDKSDSGRWL